VALDKDARVIVMEVKRDVDRNQLAQCLEYAGWARTASLGELAEMYYRGGEQFFRDWQDFTDTSAPVRIRPSPRLMLIAREFHGRTGSALEFLIENRLLVTLFPVSVYEDQQGLKFLDVSGEHEPEFQSDSPAEGGTQLVDATKIEGRRVRLTDLLDADFVQAGQELVWDRPRLGEKYRAVITENGEIQLEGGDAYSTPTAAAIAAGNVAAYDGWHAWKVGDSGGPSLHELLHELRVKIEA
jgi:hypothetical protein